MCGVIGYCGTRTAQEILLAGLKRLEYRGYDSTGIATLHEGSLNVVKKAGKLRVLMENLKGKEPQGTTGIGHTRWASHGQVNDVNAHPHLDSTDQIAIVHNGIIENYDSLRAQLEKSGHHFRSDSDSEVLAHLIGAFYEGDLKEAVRLALIRVEGTYGLLCLDSRSPDLMVAARNGSSLLFGVGEKEIFVSSDVSAIAAHTKQVVYMADGEIVKLTPTNFEISNLNNLAVDKEVEKISWEPGGDSLGSFSCFMEKELHEHPNAVLNAFRGRIDEKRASAVFGGLKMGSRDLSKIQRIQILSCGSSYYAGMVGSHLIESMARIPCSADLASELRTRNPIIQKDSLYIVISQSGETADSLFAMRELQERGASVMGICNVVGSTIAREADGGVYTYSGPEISVASTKAFTAQLTVLYLLALRLARLHHMSQREGQLFIDALKKVPDLMREVLNNKDSIQEVSRRYARSAHILFMGRGLNYGVALEGALKLKEISYVHAEGYSSSEMKHGPIALIERDFPSLFLIPQDDLRHKVLSSLREVKSRQGSIIALADGGDTLSASLADCFLPLPAIDDRFTPFTMAVALHLFAYFAARELGRDIDRPRNLSKSITIE